MKYFGNDLDRIKSKALSHPRDSFQSMAEMHTALSNYIHRKPIGDEKFAWLKQAILSLRGNPKTWAIFAFVTSSLVFACGALGWRAIVHKQEVVRQEARMLNERAVTLLNLQFSTKSQWRMSTMEREPLFKSVRSLHMAAERLWNEVGKHDSIYEKGLTQFNLGVVEALERNPEAALHRFEGAIKYWAEVKVRNELEIDKIAQSIRKARMQAAVCLKGNEPVHSILLM